MTGLTDFITEAKWSDVFTVWFVVVDDAYELLQRRLGKCRVSGPTPSFSDSEVITLALIIDTYFGGHEERALSFVRQYHLDMFPRLLPNGQFNHRRRMMCRITEVIRRHIIQEYGLISPHDKVRLLDSAPLPACTYTRGKDNQTFAGSEFFGRCSSKGTKFFGMRLHITTTIDMVVDEWLLVPAAMHDSQVVPAILQNAEQITGLADGAFNNPLAMQVLERKRGTKLWAVPRRDSRKPWPKAFRKLVSKTRRLVETALSVLSVVFKIEHLGSRSLDGFISRVATRILAHTLCFITPALLAKLGGTTPN